MLDWLMGFPHSGFGIHRYLVDGVDFIGICSSGISDVASCFVPAIFQRLNKLSSLARPRL
jgi:hypothetical protein